MAAFVLVPGAWIGGWAFIAVARALRDGGHDAYAVTLTGLGERSHLARREIDLDTHIADVVNLIRWEDLGRDVVLVGHSYAGLVVTGVADRADERLSHLVFLDSAPSPDGTTMLDYYPPEEAERMRGQVRDQGDGWRLDYPGFEGLGPPAMLEGLGPHERALLDAKAVPQPFGTYTQPLKLTGREGNYQRAVIACNGFRMIESVMPEAMSFLTPAWRRHDLATGHWPMLSAPNEVAEVLLALLR